MRAIPVVIPVFVLMLSGADAAAQQANMAHVHIGHVATAFGATPDGAGLLPTAQAEAAIAAQHAGLAARDPANLDAMKTHTGHVLHALDPTAQESGPGRGYGVKAATEAIVAHIEMAAQVEGVSQNVTTHSSHIATSARNTLERVDRGIALAREIQASTSAPAAAALVGQLQALVDQLVAGVDANADGQIGWQSGEGGLAQVEQHVNLLRRGEGL